MAEPVHGSAEPLRDEPLIPIVSSSEVAFEGAVWDIRRETFELEGQPIVREFLQHTGAVAVLALDERGRVLVIRQYRHPIRMRDWELPAGLLDTEGETPLAAAQRELAEEADLVAARWDVLCEFTSSPGGSTEVVRVYLARELSDADEVFQRTDEEAGIEVRWVDLDEAVDAVLSRQVRNGILSIAVLAAREGADRGWALLGDADQAWTGEPGQHPAHPA